MKKHFLILFLTIGSNYFCQTVAPQVINSTGKSYGTNVNGFYITDNVGEPFTNLMNGNNVIVTQGFLQPLSNPSATFMVLHNNVSCSDKKDGDISIILTNTLSNSNVKYFWTPSNLCPLNNCSKVDSLTSGNYSVKIVISHTVAVSGIRSDTLKSGPIVITDENGPCKIKIFNAITGNGDGSNDVFQIDNITEFPNNEVQIYNRWGQKLYEAKGYDNITKFWPSKDEMNKLYSSTYFYIINLGDGTKAIKGWVELIKN